MSCSSKMPLPRASIRLIARFATSLLLHGTDTGMLSGVNHECAADPERARWALLGICRAHQQNQNGARRERPRGRATKQRDEVAPFLIELHAIPHAERGPRRRISNWQRSVSG